MKSLPPVYCCLGLNKETRNLVILAFCKESKEESLRIAKARLTTEPLAKGVTEITTLNVMSNPGKTKSDLLLWLAENDIIGAEAAELRRGFVNEILKMTRETPAYRKWKLEQGLTGNK